MPIGLNHETESVNAHNESIIETGAIYGSARSSTPSGYLLCDGSAVSRTTYSRLFTVIGTSFGVGDGSTTFNIPNAQGTFLRGAGTSAGYATNVTINLGGKFDDQIQTHEHSPISFIASAGTALANGWGVSFANVYTINNFFTGGVPTSGRVNANETRVKSVAVNYFIKF